MPEINYEIALNYNTASADASLASFRSRAASQLTDLSSKFSKIDLLKGLLGDASKAVAPIADAKKKIEDLTAAFGKAKDSGFVGIGKAIAADLRLANNELKQLEKASALTSDKIKGLEAELKAAGLDTKNLVAEQKALTSALLDAQKAAAAQGARQTLGVVGAVEAKAQIDKLNEAFNILKASGLATSKELDIAQVALGQKIREVEASTRAATTTTQGFTAATLALAASFAVAGQQAAAAARAAIDYEQGLARISSISTLSKTQLAELGQETLKLTTRIGIDATTAFKALYDIVSSGVPTDNALTVLEQSAKAAVAGVTDINTASKIGVAVLNSYGQQVAELPRVFDVLFQTVKDGVISFPELSEKLGQVLPAARSAGVSLEEVSGSLVVLTRNGLNAPRAMTALEGALKQLASPGEEARQTMIDLGISFNGLQGTIEQISKKNLGPELLRKLIPDVEGQRAVGILSRQYTLLAESVTNARNSAGAAEESFKKLANTPQQQIEKFTAAMTRLKIEIGETLIDRVTASLPGLTRLIELVADGERKFGTFSFVLNNLVPGLQAAGVAVKDVLPLVNEFGPALERAGVKAGQATFQLGEVERKFLDLSKAAEQSAAVAVKAAGKYTDAFAPVATQINLAVSAINTKVAETEARLGTFADRLAAAGTASRTLFDTSNAAISQQFDQQLAAVETSIAKREITEAEGFKRIAKVRQDALAADLANLKVFADGAIAQFDREAEARIALAKKSGADVTKLEIELRDQRIKLLADIQAKYATYSLDIANQEKQITANLKAEQDNRRALIETGEQNVRAIYRDGLSSFQKRADIQRDAEENLSKLRQALVANDTKAAQQYYNRVSQLALEAIGTLTEEEKKSTTGLLVRSDAQRQLTQATAAMKAPIEANIQSLESLSKGYADLKAQAVGATVDIGEQLDNFKTSQSSQLAIRVQTDSAQIATEINKLDALLAERKPLIDVQIKVDQALADAQTLKDDIEKKKPQVVIEADTAKLRADTEAAIAALPSANINFDATKVNEALQDVGRNLDDLFARRRDVQTNAVEVSRELARINDLKFDEKTLTIKVKYDGAGLPAVDVSPGATPTPIIPGFAKGGPVPNVARAQHAALRYFANGGFVGRVPGSGNSDSEFRYLQPGSFVLRKAAVEAFTGAQKFATGGPVSLPLWLLRGIGGGGSDFSLEGFIASVNDAPIFDRAPKMRSMFDKAQLLQDASIRELRAKFPAGYIEAGAEAFSRDKVNRPRIEKVLAQYDSARAGKNSRAADDATRLAIEIANGIATPARGLTLDELQDLTRNAAAVEAAKSRMEAEAKAEAERKKAEEAGGKGGPQKRASGGSIDGSGPLIPAMLTPNEHVFSPQEVARIGLPTLMRANGGMPMSAAERMQVVRHYREGGYVEQASNFSANLAALTPGVSNVTNNRAGDTSQVFNGTVNLTNNGEQLTEAFVRNKVLPALEQILRKQGRAL